MKVEINRTVLFIQCFYDSHWQPTFKVDEEQISFWDKDKTSGRIVRTNIEVLLYCYLIIETKKEVRIEYLFKEYKDWLSKKSLDEKKQFLNKLKDFAEEYYNLPTEEELNEIAFSEDAKRFFHIIENLGITTDYLDENDWDELTIESRADDISKLVLKIWEK